MTKNLKVDPEKKRLNDTINGRLNRRVMDAVDFDIKHVFNLNLTSLHTADLKRLEKELEVPR